MDLNTQYKSLSGEIHEAMDRVFASSQYSQGSEVSSFEKAFAKFCGSPDSAAVNSGTSALHMALLAAGVGPGDEVITPTMTFVATAAAVIYCGAKPVYVDCDPITMNIDPTKIESRINERTKAILPVHLHGLMADMDPISKIAQSHNLKIIEDAAQAHGAAYHGKNAGTIGTLGCFSFYPGKNLGAYGEGGAITTADAELLDLIRKLRNWGSDVKYHHPILGFNARMDGLQGAILKVKLKRLTSWNDSRRVLAAQYISGLSDLDLILPTEPEGYRHVYHIFGVRTPRREELQVWLNERGVQTGIHYPIPVHMQPAYRFDDTRDDEFPEATKACNELLSLPMFPELAPDLVDVVIQHIRAFFDR